MGELYPARADCIAPRVAVAPQPVTNRAWKDTVLLPAGSSVDILVEFTNPGRWMLHCHIAEHMEAGMMTHFTVQ